MSAGSGGGSATFGLDAAIAGLKLPGAGPVTAARLAARGIVTIRDLLSRRPRAYDDLRRETPLAAVAAQPEGTVVLVRGTVQRVHIFPRRLLDVTLAQGEAVVRARWFHPPASMSKAFAKGTVVALAGPLRSAPDGARMLIHPSNVTAELEARGAGGLGIRPRYPAIEGVAGRLFERLVAEALARLGGDVPQLVPAAVGARLGLPALPEALRVIHHPPADLDTAALEALAAGRTAAHRRLALEELLVVQVAFLLRRAQARGVPAPIAAADVDAVLAAVAAALGFALTASQLRAARDIARDLGAAQPMQRLLIGDVGSGKTAVALAAAALVAAAGGQTLMMVPTEVLAEQHARTLGPAAARLGLTVGVLTGATAPAAREALLDAAGAGRLQLLIGTHALLDSRLAPADLRLVIVDEQHRFGVAQRAALGRRGGVAAGVPHLLVLSATPIPRTLALALHGDLDTSVLTERPGGRPLPATVVCRGADERQAAYQRLRDALGAGHQAFVICPVREQAQRAGAVTAVSRHAALRRELAPARVGLLHGALDAAAKQATLRAFAGGALDVLVATTVVELGIDVPNATVMIVEDADRFGLAQLHQLRGRVGRGAAPGVCLLCVGDEDGASSDATARLQQLSAAADGFRIAEADLALRGFGDLFGTRQAGAAVLGPGDPRETFALVELARGEAAALLVDDPALARPEHRALADAAQARLAARALYDEEAG